MQNTWPTAGTVTLPLQYRYSTVTVPLHCRCIAVALPLHCRYYRCTAVAVPLQYRCIAVTVPSHYRYITVALPLHCRYITVAWGYLSAATHRSMTVPLPFHYRSITVTWGYLSDRHTHPGGCLGITVTLPLHHASSLHYREITGRMSGQGAQRRALSRAPPTLRDRSDPPAACRPLHGVAASAAWGCSLPRSLLYRVARALHT